MHPKKAVISIAMTIAVLIALVPGAPSAAASARTRVTLDYLISYRDAQSPPQVTVAISNLSAEYIDLVISPMDLFTGQQEDESLWFVDTQKIVATAEDGQTLPFTDGAIVTASYVGKEIKYHMVRVGTQGQSSIRIQYTANRRVPLGFLETLLLRPRDHRLVGNATLRFALPSGWRAVTVLAEERDGAFPLGSMDSFYGDNTDPAYNYVPAGFVVGIDANVVEVKTDYGRLIYAYPPQLGMKTDSAEALLGKEIFEYYSTIVGPLGPFNAYIAGLWYHLWPEADNVEAGLYAFSTQHNRTIDIAQSVPVLAYNAWKWELCPGTPFFCDLPEHAYYGFPHKLLRGWLMPGGVIFLPDPSTDWFFRGGVSHYFQETALSLAFGQHRVYERFRDLYQYYQTNYVQTGRDQSLFAQSMQSDEMTSHFTNYFKSGLWALYLNQRMLEATQGEKSLSDLTRYLYDNYYGGPLTYEEIEQAVNVVAGTDLSEVWTRYAYGNEPLPLDWFFQDDDHDGLMNGLELERRSDPERADTNGNGVDDAVEYAAECQQTAILKDYCREVIPPGAKGTQPAAAATVITPAGTPRP